MWHYGAPVQYSIVLLWISSIQWSCYSIWVSDSSSNDYPLSYKEFEDTKGVIKIRNSKKNSFQWVSCYSIFSFMCMFCRSLFVLLCFFAWPFYCLFFFDLRILITLLVSSNSSYHRESKLSFRLFCLITR
jgi:hypothetical protein